MAALLQSRLVSANTRDGFDTRKKDLNVACNEKQELACEDCGDGLATHSAMGESGKVYSLCAMCHYVVTTAMSDKETLVDIEKDMCQDCTVEEATYDFLHFHRGTFRLCERCFHNADHEDAYGQDFVDVGEQEADFYAEEEDDYDYPSDPEDEWDSDGPPAPLATGSRRIAAIALGPAGRAAAIAAIATAAPWRAPRTRSNTLKFELVATVLHPTRVERSLDTYGYDPVTDTSAW